MTEACNPHYAVFFAEPLVGLTDPTSPNDRGNVPLFLA